MVNGQPVIMVAQVTLDGTNLQATINPALPDEEKLKLALKCIEMFARMAGDMAGGGKPKLQIIVPQVGFRS